MASAPADMTTPADLAAAPDDLAIPPADDLAVASADDMAVAPDLSTPHGSSGGCSLAPPRSATPWAIGLLFVLLALRRTAARRPKRP
jgi:hypothetical protein